MKLSFWMSHNRLWSGQASGGDKQTSLIYWLISLLVSGWLSRRLKVHKIRENKLWRHRTVPLQTPPCHSCDISQEMEDERCFLFKGPWPMPSDLKQNKIYINSADCFPKQDIGSPIIIHCANIVILWKTKPKLGGEEYEKEFLVFHQITIVFCK